MKFINPLHIYSWKWRSLFIFVLAISLSLWGSIYLDFIGFQIPLLRQLIGIIYLLFVPGALILRILGLNKLDNIESLLYTTGLSISFLMFLGFFINQVSIFIGILKPISILFLMTTINLIILILSIACYYTGGNNYNYTYISIQRLFSPKKLFLLLIPLLAVYGTYLVNIYDNNILIILFLIITFLIIGSYKFFNFIPVNLYSLAIWTISVSLLLHNSLISTHLWGCDIQTEYYLSKIVINNSYWDLNNNQIANSMLSIVMLAPLISNICDINLIWVFKIIYPLFFSLLPLGMYIVFEKQTTEEIAFLSCLYFISGFMYYTEMLALARQQISELFFLLLILPMFNPNIEDSRKAFLSIIFLFSIVVSHYGFSYIFMICLLLSLIIYKLIKLVDRKDSDFNLQNKLNPKQISIEKIININFIVLTFIFALSWYIYTSSGSPFSKVVQIGDFISNQIFNDFLQTQGVKIITTSAASLMRNITKYLHLISIFFVSLGIIKSFIKRKNMQFNNTYAILSFAYFMLCIIGFVVPYFASQLNTSRLYQISLLVLAPFFSIGGISFFNVILHRRLSAFWIDTSIKQQSINESLKLLSIFLATFFLFNSGFVYEVMGEESSSVSLNNTHYPFIYREGDISTVNWIYSNRNQINTIYADVGGANLLKGFVPSSSTFSLINESIYVPENNYIFITSLNTIYHQIYVSFSNQLEYIDIKYSNEYQTINTIYDSGYAKIEFV